MHIFFTKNYGKNYYQKCFEKNKRFLSQSVLQYGFETSAKVLPLADPGLPPLFVAFAVGLAGAFVLWCFLCLFIHVRGRRWYKFIWDGDVKVLMLSHDIIRLEFWSGDINWTHCLPWLSFITPIKFKMRWPSYNYNN